MRSSLLFDGYADRKWGVTALHKRRKALPEAPRACKQVDDAESTGQLTLLIEIKEQSYTGPAIFGRTAWVEPL